MSKEDEQRIYARGYAAGKRKADHEREQRKAEIQEAHILYQKITARTVQRRDAFFCAALTGILAHGSWMMGEDNSLDAQVKIARQFAEKAMKELP